MLFDLFHNRKRKHNWFKNVHEDLHELSITERITREQNKLGNKMDQNLRLKEKPKLKTGRKISEKRKLAISEIILENM